MRISCGSSDVCSSDLYAIEDGVLAVTLGGGAKTGLADPSKLAGWRGDAGAPDAILLVDNGLHIEIRIDRDHSIGRTDPAGVADVQVEAALSTIMDGEDSVADRKSPRLNSSHSCASRLPSSA